MKIIVAGGRDFKNYEVIEKVLSNEFVPPYDILVSGDAAGADTLSIKWAEKYGIPIQHFPAQWSVYGNQAGFIRNAEMGEFGDKLIAFWDTKSPGTKHMIQCMKFKKKPYKVFNYKGELIIKGNIKDGN